LVVVWAMMRLKVILGYLVSLSILEIKAKLGWGCGDGCRSITLTRKLVDLSLGTFALRNFLRKDN